jgi:hypothetical protein
VGPCRCFIGAANFLTKFDNSESDWQHSIEGALSAVLRLNQRAAR